MLYFRPLRDEETLLAVYHRCEELEDAYRKLVAYVFEKHMDVIPAQNLPTDVQNEFASMLRTYNQIRASIIGNSPVVADLARRYNGPEPTALWLAATDLRTLSSPSPRLYTFADQQACFDSLNALLGLIRFRRAKERRQIRNPFSLLWLSIKWILRLPLQTLQVMGFSVEEFEKHFWGKFLLLAFVVVLIWIVLKGFNMSIEQLTNLVSAFKK